MSTLKEFYNLANSRKKPKKPDYVSLKEQAFIRILIKKAQGSTFNSFEKKIKQDGLEGKVLGLKKDQVLTVLQIMLTE